MKNSHIIVGMSGGVDSSVTALLLKQQGYQVSGLFMKNWEQDDHSEYCSIEQDLSDASAVCEKIGIELHVVNFSDQYWSRVFEYFLSEYRAGRTPNPDVLCNKEIKFRAFLDYACNELNADKIATGHYADISKNDHGYWLHRGIDNNKDQSYFLYLLGQQQLAKSLFPVGKYTKPQIRQIAEENGLITSNKKDSTGICFIGERRFKSFLQEYLPAKPGDIITEKGEVIGRHDGLMFYTIGQRQGLGIGGLSTKSEAAWYVSNKNLSDNQLVVVQGSKHPALYKTSLECQQLHWINSKPDPSTTLTAKCRYRQDDSECFCQLIPTDNERWCVTFTKPQRAITPGQSIVFYQGDLCLGGAIIT